LQNKMRISFETENVPLPSLNFSMVEQWIVKVISEHQTFTGNITFVFCDDDHLLSINKQFLNHDYYTDVITFDYSSNKLVSGDIFISVDMVSFNSQKENTGFENELLRVIIHGVLHLIGFKDKSNSQRAEMTRQENHALSMFPR
jgi:probable rRNA maturation factor